MMADKKESKTLKVRNISLYKEVILPVGDMKEKVEVPPGETVELPKEIAEALIKVGKFKKV